MELSDAGNPGKASCGVRGSANKTVAVAGGPDLYDGKWHKLECRVIHKPTDHLELWVDGVKVASVNGAVGSIVTGTPILLGSIRPWKPAVTAGRWTMFASAGRSHNQRSRSIRFATAAASVGTAGAIGSSKLCRNSHEFRCSFIY